jgi:hypothetical protein
LASTNGSRNFDSRTHTKTVQTLLAKLDQSGIEKYLDYLKKFFARTRDSAESTAADDHDDDDDDDIGEEQHDGSEQQHKKPNTAADADKHQQSYANKQQSWAINQMLLLAKNHSLERSEAWLKDILNFVMYHAFFTAAPRANAAAAAAAATNSKKRQKSKNPADTAACAWVYDLQSFTYYDGTTAAVCVSPTIRQLCVDKLYVLIGELESYVPSPEHRGLPGILRDTSAHQ